MSNFTYTHTYDAKRRVWTNAQTKEESSLIPLRATISKEDYNAYVADSNERVGDTYFFDLTNKDGKLI